MPCPPYAGVSEAEEQLLRRCQADVPRLVVDFPYMPIERARNLKFTAKYLSQNEYQRNMKSTAGLVINTPSASAKIEEEEELSVSLSDESAGEDVDSPAEGQKSEGEVKEAKKLR